MRKTKEFICNCTDVEIGSYTNQIWVHPPAHMPNKDGYCLDKCIAEEVMQLWMKGIVTTGSCCGHKKQHPFIGVAEKDIQKMRALGYQGQHNPMRPNDEDTFYPLGYDSDTKYPVNNQDSLSKEGKAVCVKCRFETECRFKAENTEQNCKFFIDKLVVF